MGRAWVLSRRAAPSGTSRAAEKAGPVMNLEPVMATMKSACR